MWPEDWFWEGAIEEGFSGWDAQKARNMACRNICAKVTNQPILVHFSPDLMKLLG